MALLKYLTNKKIIVGFTQKNNFAEIFKNLAKYRSENNFGGSYK